SLRLRRPRSRPRLCAAMRSYSCVLQPLVTTRAHLRIADGRGISRERQSDSRRVCSLPQASCLPAKRQSPNGRCPAELMPGGARLRSPSDAGSEEPMEPLTATLNRARETKNTVRYEEPETDQPLVIGTLYVHKWAVKRLEDPEVITVTIAAAEK